MCSLSIKPVPYPGPGKAFSAVADISRGTSLGDNMSRQRGQLSRDWSLEVAKQLLVRKHHVLGVNQRTVVALSTEVLSVARELLLSRFSLERSEQPLVWGDGFLPSAVLKYKGRWVVGAAHRTEALHSLFAYTKASEEHMGAPTHQGLLTCFVCL